MKQASVTMAVATASLASAMTMGLPAIARADTNPPLAALGPPPVPWDNRLTPKSLAKPKIELGKMLFFDPRLSGDGTISCATCHHPTNGWGFPNALSMGYPGSIHWRNSQTVINSAYYEKLMWAGSGESLETQASGAARGAVAGNGAREVMGARLAFIPEYRERFADVFGDVIPRLSNAWRAIAAFERTLVQTDTPFDKYMGGDKAALSDQQKRGLELFEGKANCIECHNGALFSDQKYYNLGVPPAPDWIDNGLAQITLRFELFAKGVSEEMYRKTKDDPGLYFRTKQVSDKGKFRTQSLRYTKYTAPYMHNGALETLADVVEFYNRGGSTNEFSANKTKLLKPLKLSKEEKADLVAFIESLSGPQIEMEEPNLPPIAPLPAAASN